MILHSCLDKQKEILQLSQSESTSSAQFAAMVCNSTNSCSLFPKLPFPFHLPTFSIFFALIIPLISGLSFNLTNTNFSNILYESTTGFVRNTYFKPLQLWDNATGNLTDFTTQFSFSINLLENTSYGGGFAFFLEPDGSKLPPNVTQDSTLGLTRDNQQLNTTENHFVAVEFDIYSDYFDPPGEHVGIDINSMQSVRNISWMSDIKGGEKNDAWIRYNSGTHNLSVAFTGFRNNTVVMQSLSQVVNLRDYLPERVTFGFSVSNQSFEVLSWDFNSNLEIDNNATSSTENHRKKINKKGLAAGLGVSVAMIILAGLFWLFIKCRKRHEEADHVLEEYMDDEFERGTGPKRFSYHELARATNNFRDEEKLGEGGFGAVYKGFLREMNLQVAVKRVSSGSKQGIKEYAAEVKIISRLRHRNLVQLIGWCHERRELLLVYEFLHNGSLDSHLFSENALLTWEVRYRIARGLASGLLYLHEEWEQCVVHRDIKSSNIMLDSEFNAKLGDFGLARIVDHGKGSQTTVLAGTMGYMAPEYMTTGKARKESDVYSFGIVALEIACGRKPINTAANEDQVNLVQWVWGLYGEGRLVEAVDPRLRGDFDEKEMECLMIVGLWSAHPDENIRPSIRQSLHVLNFDAPLPNLPPKMPVATYLYSSVTASSLSLPSYSVTDSDGSRTNLQTTVTAASST